MVQKFNEGEQVSAAKLNALLDSATVRPNTGLRGFTGPDFIAVAAKRGGGPGFQIIKALASATIDHGPGAIQEVRLTDEDFNTTGEFEDAKNLSEKTILINSKLIMYRNPNGRLDILFPYLCADE